MHKQAEVEGPRARAAANEGDRLRAIHVDRKELFVRASAAQRRRRQQENEERRLAKSRYSWLFGGTRRLHEDEVESPSSFASNIVVSAKYSAWNFCPRVLFAQLKRPSNMYFLFIALLQSIRDVSNTRGIPTILLPLAIVLVCSAIKEALEDRERHRADGVANGRPVMTLTPLGNWELRKWKDLRVGDIVTVMNDETIPADLFLLSADAIEHNDSKEASLHACDVNVTSDAAEDTLKQSQSDEASLSSHESQEQRIVSSNIAYIETKSLDGETNLKIRTVIPIVAAFCRGSNSTIDGDGHNKLRGTMLCEQPNNRTTTFEGTFSAILSSAEAQRLGVAAEDLNSTSHSLQLTTLMQSPSDHYQNDKTEENHVRVHVPVTAKQMLLRNCVLRNTYSITGMVVFTGHETKVFCSNTEPVVKTSSVERRLNRLIIGIVFLQQLVCFLGALLGVYWMRDAWALFWYLFSATEREQRTLAGAPALQILTDLVKLHLRYFIIMQNFIPISLNVSLEFVKYWQAYFIQQDLEMYDEQSDTPAMVRSSALNEDLGRVHHIFTDKTGTLTMNLMLFRYFMVNGKHYGGRIQENEMEAENSSGNVFNQSGRPQYVDFDPTELFADILLGGEQSETLCRFLRHLALCHTLIPTKSLAEMCSTSFPEYSASSPDEQALVSAAAYCNVRFVHRTPTAMMLLEPGQTVPRTYNLLNVLEFDSDRKRMTVIVETPDGTIDLLCKGADNVIFKRLAINQATMPTGMSCEQALDQLTLYAKAGMRTLCLAYKTISRCEYEAWNTRYTQAHASMEELVKRRQGYANAIDPLMNEIESNLILLGVTAVQDKLQAGVPETLRLLQETNIKLWTLTGDKMETAINIGYASALLSHNMNVQQIAGDDYASTANALKKLSKHSDEGIKSFYQLPLSPPLTSTNSKVNKESRVRHARSKRPRMSIQTGSLLESVKERIGNFFAKPTKSKRKRRRHYSNRSSRTSSPFRQSPLYSSVATDAEMGNKVTSDEESLDVVGIEADDETIPTHVYGTLDKNRKSNEGSRHLALQKLALVIDGQALEYAFRPQLRKLFYEVTRRCGSAVICCRVSPKQKADIVEFIREFEPDSITLAIGDGANDVAMIQTAHIGVGISGQEGAQAVNASDYALAQFRYLQRLLFVHGRWAYRRVAKLMSYMLYKNVTYVLTTFWFGCFSGFSGQPLLLDVAAQSFNVLYTSMPLILFAVLDQDVSSASATKFPRLYALGQTNALLARRVFWPWIFNGIWHSIVIFFISAWAFEGFGFCIRDSPVIATKAGKSGGLVTLGFVVFTNLVLVVNLKLCIETFLLTWPFVLTVTISILLWFAVGTLISLPNAGFLQATGEMEYLQKLPTFWLACLLVLALSLLRDGLWKIVRRLALPKLYHILQERELLGLPITPSRLQQERRQSVADKFWFDNPDIIDCPSANKSLSRVENPEEALLRSSPLGERLIASPYASSFNGGEVTSSKQAVEFQSREMRRNIRVRGSFLDGFNTDIAVSSQVPSGYLAATNSANSVVGNRSFKSGVGGGGSYHGYAFSEDENVDSDVEAASSKTRQGDVDPGKAAIGAHVAIKKVLKSVRGRKNA
ncbi:hypothetical protein CCR75_007199 [Bremia lactucae]|uniref:Phospholipid-transporting ATPase n=1 Tax=Bremia lactucae TaxID=4779 RepID=A0A976FFI7_BRELC|nr:hypothetical protein CCR75_007199 [Bremia lactucae]